MPRPEKVDLQNKEDPGPDADQSREPAARRPGSELEPQVTDTERVADLIARQQRKEAD
jgi:hypothetical protein